MSDTFAQAYDILGLRPGDGWKELKIAYRRRMREWHPDRFPGDDVRKKRADEKTKTINKAYKELTDYYRRHGILPLQAPRASARVRPRYESPVDPAPATVAATWRNLRTFLTLHPRVGIVAAVAVATFVIYILLSALPPHEDADPLKPSAPSGSVDARTPQRSIAARNEPYFTVGSTIGEVYSSQGVPTKTETDVWHYGNSKVYFTNGVVTKWESTSERPLNARIDRDPDHAPLLFTRGSTKADVRQIQGTPVRETDKVWDYGISRVYFEGDRVVDWYESPINPLRVKR